MFIKWLVEKIFIPESDYCFQVKASDGYLVQLERKMEDKGIAMLEKTETRIRFRCKDTEVGGWWRIGVHKIEVIAIEAKEGLYDITINFLGVKNLAVLISAVLWMAVFSQVISQNYLNLIILLPIAIISPHFYNWQAMLLVAWKIELWLSAPVLVTEKSG